MDLSADTMIAGLFVSAVGTGLFVYGKKQRRWPQLATGIALMASTFLSGSSTTMFAIGGGLVLAMTLAVRSGF